MELTATLGGFQAEERSAEDETYLYGAQLAARFNLDKKSYLQAGGTYYYWDNIQGFATLYDPLDSFGNSAVEVTEPAADPLAEPEVVELRYRDAFQEAEGFVHFGFEAGVPVLLYASAVVNTEAEDDDTGYIGGVKLGKCKDPGSMEFDYNYRQLEANAVVGAFTDSDSGGGGTDVEGHRIRGTYQISKNWQCGATLFVNEIGISGDSDDYLRGQVDLMAKF